MMDDRSSPEIDDGLWRREAADRMMCDFANQENVRVSRSFMLINQPRQLTGGPRFERLKREEADRERRRQWRLSLVFLIFGFAMLLWGSGAFGADLFIPDPAMTPGIATSASVDQVCGTKWGSDRRHVSAAMRREVFARYPACRRCEIDHLIPRELGGADDIKNLWPQPYGGLWNVAMKDRVEARLHREVCSGTISLEHAQNEIRLDWRIPYRRYFGEPK